MNRNLRKDLGFKADYENDDNALSMESEKIKKLVFDNLSFSERERTVNMKKRRFKTVLAVAAICALSAVTVCASGTVREKISEMISYFKNDKAVEMSDPEKLAEFNKVIGKSAQKDGYTLTLDNIIADENYVHVFYTLESEKGTCTDSMHEPDIYVSCLIDGKFAENSANNNKRDFYAEDEHTLKFAEKYNISGMDIKDKFSVELVADTDNSYEIFNKLCSGKEISENDKKNALYVSVITDKTQEEKNGYSKEFDIPLWQKGTRLKRFILSPFASQLVIESDKNAKLSDTVFFAAFDENGKSLDVLNTGLMHSDKKKSYNSYELLKVTDDTKEISLVPINFDEVVNSEIIRKKADEYPLKYKLGQDGYVVVTAVRFKDGEIDVDYRKDGFTTFDPEFYFYGADGKEIEMPGIKSVDVHYDTNSYTAKYVSNSKNANLPERLKSEALKNTLKELGCVKNEVKLEYEKAVKIKLR